jgi:hypothetical protein
MGPCAPYAYNKEHPRGHSQLSIKRISKFIFLTELEENLIGYHMGVYGSMSWGGDQPEYTIRQLTDAWRNPALYLMSAADQLVTLEEKAAEREFVDKHGSLSAVDGEVLKCRIYR